MSYKLRKLIEKSVPKHYEMVGIKNKYIMKLPRI